MDPISTIGAVASIVQLASAAISLSKSLYSVGSAISSAPEDIQSLAEDLEDFAGSLNIFSRLLGDSESFYSDDIYLCAAKIMRDASNLYVKIQRLVGKLGRGGWKARVRWGFKEDKVRKLMARLRDMKGSLVHVTVSLHLDLELSRLGISSGSKLQRGEGRVLRPETIQRLEEASRVVKANDILVQNSLSLEFRDKSLEQPIVLSSNSKSTCYESQEEMEMDMDWQMTSLKIGSTQDNLTVEKSMSTAKGPLPARTGRHRVKLAGPTRLTPAAKGGMRTRAKPEENMIPSDEKSLTRDSAIPAPFSPQKKVSQAILNRTTGNNGHDKSTGAENQIDSAVDSVIGESFRPLHRKKRVPAFEEATTQYQAHEATASPIISAAGTSFPRKLPGRSIGMGILPPPIPPSLSTQDLAAAMGIQPPPPRPMFGLMALSQITTQPASLTFKKTAPSLKSLPSIDSFKSAVSVQNEDSQLKTRIEEVVEDILHASQTAMEVFKTTVDEKAPRSWQFETATNLLKVRLGDGWASIKREHEWYLKADETRYACDFKEVDVEELEKIPSMLMTGIVVELHMHSTKPNSFREGLFKRLCSVSDDCRVKACFQLKKIQRTTLFPDLEWKRAASEWFPPMHRRPEPISYLPLFEQQSNLIEEEEHIGMFPTLEELFPQGLPEEGNSRREICSVEPVTDRTTDYWYSTNNAKSNPQMNPIKVDWQPPYMVPLPPTPGRLSSSGSPGRKSSKPFRATASQSDAGLLSIMGNGNNVEIARQAGAKALAGEDEMANEPEDPIMTGTAVNIPTEDGKPDENRIGGLSNLTLTKKPKRRGPSIIDSLVPNPSHMSSIDHKAPAKHRVSSRLSDRRMSKRGGPKYIPQPPRKLESGHSHISPPFPPFGKEEKRHVQEDLEESYHPTDTNDTNDTTEDSLASATAAVPSDISQSGVPSLKIPEYFFSPCQSYNPQSELEGNHRTPVVFGPKDTRGIEDHYIDPTDECFNHKNYRDSHKLHPGSSVPNNKATEGARKDISVADSIKIKMRNFHENAKAREHARKEANDQKDDWSGITDREERRRIQNRIAQRKFRDKAKEQKARAENQIRNQEHAGTYYHTPDPYEMNGSNDPSGLPWGSASLKHVVTKNIESKREEARRLMGPNEYQSAHEVCSTTRYDVLDQNIPQPLSSSGTSSGGMSSRQPRQPDQTNPIPTPLYVTAKTYRSQSYSVGQLHPESPSSAAPPPASSSRGGRMLPYSGFRKRPTSGGMSSKILKEGRLSEADYYEGQISWDQKYGYWQPHEFEESRGGATSQQKGTHRLNPTAPSFTPGFIRSDGSKTQKENMGWLKPVPERHSSATEGSQYTVIPATDITVTQEPNSQTKFGFEALQPKQDSHKFLRETIEQLSKHEQARLQTIPSLFQNASLWTKSLSSLHDKHPQIFSSLNHELAKRTTIIFPSKVSDDTGKSLLTLSWEVNFKLKQTPTAWKLALDFQEKITTTIFAVDKQIGLEMSSFAWNCIWLLLLDYHESLLFPDLSTISGSRLQEGLLQLLEVIGVVARYAVMENLYLQTPTLTVRQDYEDEMVDMCILILRYIEKSFTTVRKFAANENENTVSDRLDLSKLIVEMKRKDEMCQKFTVTIEEVDVGGSESGSGIEEFESSDEDNPKIGESIGAVV